MLIIKQLAKTAQQSGGGAAHPVILAGLQRYAEEHIVPPGFAAGAVGIYAGAVEMAVTDGHAVAGHDDADSIAGGVDLARLNEHIVPVTAGFGALVHGLLNGPGANLAVHSAQIGNIENTFLLRCAGNCGKQKDKEWKKSFHDVQRYAFPDNPVRVVSKKNDTTQHAQR